MNTTGISSTDLAALRNENARRRTGQDATSASQLATIANATEMPEPWSHGKVANETHREAHTDRCDFGAFVVAVDGTTTDARCTSFLSIYNPTTTCAMNHSAQKALLV